uniref:RasGAP_C domain-containing protein n=1 Tax=Heterorhabditis bacteriophora TaxID=37862 RepID=A0A1I7WK56_HETBA
MICRRKEQVEQRRNLEATQNKLQAQRKELNERLSRYEEYIDTCLENLNRTSRRLSFRPNTKEAGKIQKKRQSLDVIQSFKSSADKLFRKGVLIDVLNPEYQNAKRITKLSVDIASTEKKGIFKITLIEGKEVVNNFSLNFQDLLKSDSYENERFVLNEVLVLDVPRTIQYINRKFYNNNELYESRIYNSMLRSRLISFLLPLIWGRNRTIVLSNGWLMGCARFCGPSYTRLPISVDNSYIEYNYALEVKEYLTNDMHTRGSGWNQILAKYIGWQLYLNMADLFMIGLFLSFHCESNHPHYPLDWEEMFILKAFY